MSNPTAMSVLLIRHRVLCARCEMDSSMNDLNAEIMFMLEDCLLIKFVAVHGNSIKSLVIIPEQIGSLGMVVFYQRAPGPRQAESCVICLDQAFLKQAVTVFPENPVPVSTGCGKLVRIGFRDACQQLNFGFGEIQFNPARNNRTITQIYTNTSL